MFGQSLRLSSYPKGLNNNDNDPDFSRSNVFCWCKSTRFQCMRIILFRFQHPEPTGSYRYAVFFSPGPTFLKAHRWHSIKREDKAGKKNTRSRSFPWATHATMGFDHRFFGSYNRFSVCHPFCLHQNQCSLPLLRLLATTNGCLGQKQRYGTP